MRLRARHGTPPRWSTIGRREARFQQSELQAEQDTRSASIVLIKGNEEPYGVLAAGSSQQYGFSQEDVNFMQAIANVLANAIERRRTEERTQHEASTMSSPASRTAACSSTSCGGP